MEIESFETIASRTTQRAQECGRMALNGAALTLACVAIASASWSVSHGVFTIAWAIFAVTHSVLAAWNLKLRWDFLAIAREANECAARAASLQE